MFGKTIIFSSFVLIFSLISLDTSAQKSDIPITESFRNTDLKVVLKTLSENYKLKFAYDEVIVSNIKITAELRNLSTEKALKKIFSNTKIDYRLSGNTYLLYASTVQKTQQIAPTILRKTFSIHGVVKDCKSGETLPYVFVKDSKSTAGTWANEDGYFTLNGLSGDSLRLEFIFLGYNTKTISVNDKLNSELLTVNLDAAEQTLQEIIVHSDAFKVLEIKNNGEQKTTINPQFFRSVPNFGQTDAFKAVQLLPGVSGASESAAEIKVQGGNIDQNLILFDGFTVYHLDHFYGIFSAFNSDAIKNIDIYKAGFGAKYGGRVSSVIDITGKSGNFQKFSGTANLNLMNASASLEIPILKNKLSLFVAGRRSYSDFFGTYLYHSLLNGLQSESVGAYSGESSYYFNDDNNQTSFRFYDLNSKLTYRPDKNNTLSVSVFRGNDRFDNKFLNADFKYETESFYSEKNAERTTWGNSGVSGKWSRKWNSAFYTKFGTTYSEYYSNFENSWKNSYFDTLKYYKLTYYETQKNTIRDFGTTFGAEYLPNEKHRIEAGAEFNYLKTMFDYSGTGFTFFDQQPVTLFSVYLFDNYKFTKAISLTAGFRNTLNSLTEKVYFEPRISAKIQVNDVLCLVPAFGVYNQFLNQTYNDNIMSGSHDFWVISDGNSKPVLNAMHAAVSANLEYKTVHFSASVYHKKFEGISGFRQVYGIIAQEQSLDDLNTEGDSIPTDDSDYEEILTPENQFFTGDGYINGGEFMIYKNAGIWNGWLCASYFDKVMNFDVENSIYSQNSTSERNFEFKTVNQLNFGTWYLSASWVFNARNPVSEPVSNYRLALSDGQQTKYLNISSKEAVRALNYHRLDVSGGKVFKTKFAKFTLGASLLNVYNRENIKLTQFYLSYWDDVAGTVSEHPSVVANAVKLAGITPVFFLNIDF